MAKKELRAALAFCAALAASCAMAAEVTLPAPEGDATKLLQGAFSDRANTKVTLGRGDYVVAETIRIVRSNLEVVLLDGARIIAKKGAFHHITRPMIELDNGAEHITFRGEGSATLEMRLRDYQDKSQGYAFSEWRHIILIRRASNVTIRDLLFTRSGGDGVDMHSGAHDVLIEDCRFIDNNRLGVAASDIRNLTVRRCYMEANNGAWPKGGVDLEPNFEKDHVLNVLFEDCTFKGHEGCGFVLHVLKLTPKSEPVSVVLRNCRSIDNKQVGFNVTATGQDGPCRGSIRFENCVSENNKYGDLKQVFIAEEGLKVETSGCNFKSVDILPWVKPEDAAPFRAQEVKPLVKDSSGVASSGWLRWDNWFVQPVPCAGKYKMRFDVKRFSGDSEYGINVVVTDALGTERDNLKVGPGGLDYEFETVGANCLQFRMRPFGGVGKVSTRIPGGALRADRYVSIFEKDPNRKFRFRVPGDCEEVRVGVNPEEPVEAALFDAAGREVAHKRFERVAGTLSARRAKTEKDEVWMVDLSGAVEDAKFKIAAPCPPVAELVPVPESK